MPRTEPTHTHDQADTTGVGPAWFTALDWAVWIAIILIAGLGVEWLFGAYIREMGSRQAARFLSKRTTHPTDQE